ncbi:hypothetical protein HMPREF1396_00347 [Helicobacter pylori GAM114Ai]|nr:hypothetical protein HMPREF1396_00347 [Helicobacter pylori GAM114Ai]
MKNETLEQFKRDQKRNQEILKKLLDLVHTGEEYGITASRLKNLSKTRSVMRWKCWRSKT